MEIHLRPGPHPHVGSNAVGRYFLLSSLCLLALSAAGCASHSSHTEDARAALDQGNPQKALGHLNEQLGVDPETADLPDKVEPNHQLFVLDRSLVLQWLDDLPNSSRDLETADKGIEILDFSRSTTDDISKFMFSDDSGPYQAPPYEKLMINTMNMMNYLVQHNLNGARIEARRFEVMQKFIADHEDQGKALSGPGSYLAGFIFEKSGRSDEALLYYDEALNFADYRSLHEPIRRLAGKSSNRANIKAVLEAGGPAPKDDGSAELLVIVNYGRVPAKIARRVPIGVALTLAAGDISPTDQAKANELAGQGLVTWVNFPTLDKPRGNWGTPQFWLDGRPEHLEAILNVDTAAVQEWESVQGIVVGSAITRMITRIVAGQVAKKASGGGALGTLLSLGTQATMTATDTPDTRSWSTLPARIAFGRVRVPAGEHRIRLQARGRMKEQTISLEKNSWGVVLLTVLR